jgi:hypothetical protein
VKRAQIAKNTNTGHKTTRTTYEDLLVQRNFATAVDIREPSEWENIQRPRDEAESYGRYDQKR